MGPKREYVEEVGDENMMPPGVEYEDDDDKQLPVALSAYAQGRATPITAGVYNPLSVHSILKKRRTGKEKGASTWRSGEGVLFLFFLGESFCKYKKREGNKQRTFHSFGWCNSSLLKA